MLPWWKVKRQAEPLLAIVNGFGRSLGDGIIGLQALHAGQYLGLLPRPVLVRGRFGPMVNALYRMVSDFADLEHLPEALATTPPAPLPPAFRDRYARVIDIRDFAFDPDFRGVAMIDFFLTRLGIAPATLPPSLRRNTWLAHHITPVKPQGLPERYLLFCPRASMRLRDIPPAAQHRLLATVSRAQSLPIVTQGEALPGTIPIGDLSSLESLCGLIAHATRIVSTDTGILHLADAFNVLSFAIFTTHRPEWRVRDYPGCTPHALPVQGLPPALEFQRNAQDLQSITQAWIDGAADLDAAVETWLTQNE